MDKIVHEIRAVRPELNLTPKTALDVQLRFADLSLKDNLETYLPTIKVCFLFSFLLFQSFLILFFHPSRILPVAALLKSFLKIPKLLTLTLSTSLNSAKDIL